MAVSQGAARQVSASSASMPPPIRTDQFSREPLPRAACLITVCVRAVDDRFRHIEDVGHGRHTRIRGSKNG
jgi:hypothetical protein